MRSTKFKIFITVFLVYLFYIAPGYITANTNRYIILTKSMVDGHTFDIDKYHTMTRDKALYKGHYYIAAAPGLSFMAAPLYILTKPILKLLPAHILQDVELSVLNFVFTFFLAALPGAVIAVLLYDIFQEFNLERKQRMLLTFTTSFGTLLFFYSTRFMAHTMSAFLLLSSFYILFKFKNDINKRFLFFLAGMCTSGAVFTDYILLIGAVLIFIYFISNFKKWKFLNYIYFISGSLISLFLYMCYHYICFDNPFTGSFAYGVMYNKGMFFLPRLKTMFELTFGTFRGAFFYMPILLFSVCGIYVFFQKPEKKYLKELTFITLLALSFFLFISGYDEWEGGGAFGPRYFIPVLPFLMILTGFAFRKIRYNIILSISFISIFINWCGVQYGDADSVFTDVGLFALSGLNSNITEWLYEFINNHIRQFNVVTHFSPFTGLVILLAIIGYIWRDEIYHTIKIHFCEKV